MIASGLAGASAAGTVRAAPPGTVASFSTPGSFNGVAVLSARSAWAVGSAGSKTLIVRWNGTAWKRVPSPAPAPESFLSGVAATSAGSAWAVGYTDQRAGTCRGCRTLILRWNGTAWKWVPSPNPPGGSSLVGVAALSAGSAWAVGHSGGKTLILRWNGTVWKRVPSPTPAGGGILTGVAATSATSAWAVGCTGGKTLILRWNGTRWKRVPSPNPSPDHAQCLAGVSAASASDAWAVGYTNGGGKTLIVRWNGIAWK